MNKLIIDFDGTWWEPVNDISYLRAGLDQQSLSKTIRIDHVQYKIISINPKKCTITIQPTHIRNMLTPLR